MSIIRIIKKKNYKKIKYKNWFLLFLVNLKIAIFWNSNYKIKICVNYKIKTKNNKNK